MCYTSNPFFRAYIVFSVVISIALVIIFPVVQAFFLASVLLVIAYLSTYKIEFSAKHIHVTKPFSCKTYQKSNLKNYKFKGKRPFGQTLILTFDDWKTYHFMAPGNIEELEWTLDQCLSGENSPQNKPQPKNRP